MLVPIGKIPGHSGTDFKHQKVFKNNSVLTHSSTDILLESRDEGSSYNWFSYIRVFITFSVVILSLILIFSLAYRIDTIELNADKTRLEELNFVTHKKVQDYQYLLDESYILFEKGFLTKAHEKLYAFLLVDPDNKEAEYLLLNVLETKCKKKRIGCRDSKYYADALDYKYNHYIK